MSQDEWLERVWVNLGTKIGRARTELLVRLRDSEMAPRFRALYAAEVKRREALES